VSLLDPPADCLTLKIWAIRDGWWRYDIQYPGPPRGRQSGGEYPSRGDAARAAIQELKILVGEGAA